MVVQEQTRTLHPIVWHNPGRQKEDVTEGRGIVWHVVREKRDTALRASAMIPTIYPLPTTPNPNWPYRS